MLGVSVGLQAPWSMRRPVALPDGFDWDLQRFGFGFFRIGSRYGVDVAPRDLVNSQIWTGAAIHVDGVLGDDANSGLGAQDGDFSDAKRTIHAAFLAGNATNAPYRVLVKAGLLEETAFTRNGNEEPDQPVAVIGWGGAVRYRTGPHVVNWTVSGGTYAAAASGVQRVFRTDILTPEGQYSELTEVPDVAACALTPDSWAREGTDVHVNIGGAPGPEDIALIRSFHGARFLTHAEDFYLENIHIEGGITGALHFDAVAERNIVGVNCSFRYSAPSNPAAPLDAARVRRTDGLIAFFGCDASQGAKDGWSFHEDGTSGMHVLLVDSTAHRNGSGGAQSCNAMTVHDSARAIVLNGDYGLSRNGTEVHCIQSTRTWLAGARAEARDVDGTSVAYKCSNASFMWLQDCVADASGSVENYALEANAGTVFIRDFTAIDGTVAVSLGGSVTPF